MYRVLLLKIVIICLVVFDNNYVSLNSAQIIYDSPFWIFGILSSKMHMAWLKVVGGRLKNDYRYSVQLVYNTFPFPKITEAKWQK